MAFYRRLWVTAFFIVLLLIGWTTFWLNTRPLITMDKVKSISEVQLHVLNIASPFFSSINLVWYNSGNFLSYQRVYVYRVSYQSGPGSSPTDVEILINSRNGNVVSAFEVLRPYNPILLGS